MAVTAGGGVFNSASPGTGFTLLLSASVPAGATIVVGIHDRAETAAVSTVVDDVNAGGYSVADGPDSHSGATTARSWLYYKTNCAAGTTTVTVTLDSSVNCAGCACFIDSDLAATMDFETIAAVAEFTGVVSPNPINSNTFAVAAAGCIVGFFSATSNGTCTATGTNESVAATAAGRGHLLFEPFTTGGTYGLETTNSATQSGLFQVASFLETVTAAGPAHPRAGTRRMLLGVS